MEHIGELLKEQGIDFYRQDFNFDPLPIWRANDAPDRQGITEIRHVTGYLAYWDELRRRLPTCALTPAGAGRRDDLETLRRAVPLGVVITPMIPQLCKHNPRHRHVDPLLWNRY